MQTSCLTAFPSPSSSSSSSNYYYYSDYYSTSSYDYYYDYSRIHHQGLHRPGQDAKTRSHLVADDATLGL